MEPKSLHLRLRASLLAIALLVSAPWAIAADEKVYWRAEADDPYLQEFGEQVPTGSAVTGIAVLDGAVYAILDGAVHKLNDNTFSAVSGSPAGVSRIRVLDGALWAAGANGLHALHDGVWTTVGEGAFVDMCLHLGVVHAATQDDIFRVVDGQLVNIKPESGYLTTDSTMVMEDFSQVLADPVRIGPIKRIGSYSGTMYLLRNQGLGLINIDQFVADPIDWGTLPPGEARDLLPIGSRAFVATNRGLAVLRGMAMTVTTGDEGLPYEDTTCLAEGFADDLWIGTSTGAIRMVDDSFQYFGAENWLPANGVNDIAVGDMVVYVATNGGLGVIHYEPYTMAKKAAYFERELEAWGQKRLGFVHKLYWSDAENGWLREISDNDGGNTAQYLAAMSYKYAVTKDKKDRAEAVNAFMAMAWCDAITPKPGFIARAVWAEGVDQGQRSTRGSGGLPAKWYPTEDGVWQWKGDTSSDEVNAHMFAVTLFHDLAAEGAEKDRAAKHIANITTHIMDNGWVLRDMDGKATRWGRWDPDYLLKPYGAIAAGLNGMEAQSYVWAAYAMTGDQKYMDGLKQLMEWRYHTYTVRQKLTFPPDTIVPWDDELAFHAYYPMLKYCDDPDLRSIYLRSLERSWEVKRMEHVPFFNFAYGALTGNDCEVDRAVEFLRAFPMDLVSRRYTNSHRADLAPEKGYVPYGGGTRGMSPRETDAKWGSMNTLNYDGGSGGRVVTPPIAWLENYWMGRYYGFIQAPDIKDKTLLEVKGPVENKGAAPYNGPARPDNQIMAY